MKAIVLTFFFKAVYLSNAPAGQQGASMSNPELHDRLIACLAGKEKITEEDFAVFEKRVRHLQGKGLLKPPVN